MQSNTEADRNQTVNFVRISVENKPYRVDSFTIRDGRYVGHDGFVVPKDFDEFHERFPDHVRDWVKRHVDRSTPREGVEDWAQDLLIHLRYLPAISKHREDGKQDIVQTFDPHKHYGASIARFFNYINLCLCREASSDTTRRIAGAHAAPFSAQIARSPSVRQASRTLDFSIRPVRQKAGAR